MAALSDRQMLEAAIAADFDDVAAHSAYADLLVEEGDPRGEYIQLRLALENRDQSPRLLRDWEERATRLLQQYQREWLGPLANSLLGLPDKPRSTVEPDTPNIEFRCRRGWLTEIDVWDVRDAFITILAGAPEARMLQELTLRNTLLPNNRGPLERLRDAMFLGSLASFTIGDPEAFGPTADGSQVAALVRQMPRLRHLDLRTNNLPADLFAALLPNLRSFYAGFLPALPWSVLAGNASLAGLERLWLSTSQVNPTMGEWNLGPPIEFEAPAFRAFLAAPHFGRLADLTLHVPGLADAGCQEIAQSGLLTRLKRLDLRTCDITDDGAQALARCPDLGHLDRLDIGQNRLTGVGVDALLAVGIAVQYDSQWGEYPEMPPAEDYGFV